MSKVFLTNDMEKNIKIINDNIPSNFNFITRDLLLKGNIKCTLLYMCNLSKKDSIEDRIITPLLFYFDNEINITSSIVEYISQRYIAISDTNVSADINIISDGLKRGHTIVLIEGQDEVIICNTSKSNFKKISEIKIEESIRGEKSAFVDTLNINLGLIQEKLKNNNLKIDKYTFGTENNIEAALVYMSDTIDDNVLKKLKNRLNSIKSSYIPDTGYVTKYLDESRFSLFPQSKTTEKPNKVISDILQGKAAIFINGCAYAVIVPVVFIEFFQTFEDYSNRFILANFDRILRILSVLIVITLSPVYLVLLNYNAELLPLNFIKVIIMSRQDIPLPPFLEILIMEIIIEFLREGGLRLPSIVGQTLSIVGGIILGQAAIQASIVSPATLIVVTVSVIATFVIPNYQMSVSIRLLRFFLLIVAQMLGLYGVIIGLFFITAHLINLESLGIPYFSPFAPIRNKDLKDSIIRFPLEEIDKAPVTFTNKEKKKKQNE